MAKGRPVFHCVYRHKYTKVPKEIHAWPRKGEDGKAACLRELTRCVGEEAKNYEVEYMKRIENPPMLILGNPRQELLNSASDMKWLRDVHLKGLPKKYKSAVVSGNMDWPEKIEVYEKKHPLLTDTPLAFTPDEDGNFDVRRGNPGVTFEYPKGKPDLHVTHSGGARRISIGGAGPMQVWPEYPAGGLEVGVFDHGESKGYRYGTTMNIRDAGPDMREAWAKARGPNPQMLILGNPASGPADEAAARELELFIDNDADLYRQQTTPIIANLMRKRRAGKFDFEKSVKLWMYLMESGAKKYIAEFGTPGQKIDSMFNKNTRLLAARRFAESFVTEADLGNWDHILREGNPLTPEEHRRLRGVGAAYESAREKFDPRRYKRGGGYTPADVAAIEKMAGGRDLTNEERNEIELYEFVNDPPEKYFAYYDNGLTKITTFMGGFLGRIVSKGPVFRSNMGDRRVNIVVSAINGRNYSGTAFLDSGTYVRLKVMKGRGKNPVLYGDNLKGRPMKPLKFGPMSEVYAMPGTEMQISSWRGGDLQPPSVASNITIREVIKPNRGRNPEGWRSYGPGKFHSIVDSYVYNISLDGADEQVGEAQDFGWYGMMRFKPGELLISVRDAARASNDTLTLEEADRLKKIVGVIINETEQGFVYVEYYTSKQKLESHWKKIEADAEEFYQQSDEYGDNPLTDSDRKKFAARSRHIYALARREGKTYIGTYLRGVAGEDERLSEARRINPKRKEKYAHCDLCGATYLGTPGMHKFECPARNICRVCSKEYSGGEGWDGMCGDCADKAESRGENRGRKPKNPWAICTTSVGRRSKKKYERCVQSVKSRMRGKNPGGLPSTIANDPAFKAELAAFRKRHGNIPVTVTPVNTPKGYPKYMSAYGTAPEVKYDAPKGSKKGKRFHIFGKRGKGRPHLVSSVERGPKFLAFVGGDFKAKTDWLYN